MNKRHFGKYFIIYLLLVLFLNFFILIQDNRRKISFEDRNLIVRTEPLNLALAMPTWVESVWSGYPKENANDGHLSTAWRAASLHSWSWWKVQLDNIQVINKITIYFGPDDYMGEWAIEVSNSSSFLGEEIIVASGTNNNQDIVIAIFDTIKAQYVRINGTV